MVPTLWVQDHRMPAMLARLARFFGFQSVLALGHLLLVDPYFMTSAHVDTFSWVEHFDNVVKKG